MMENKLFILRKNKNNLIDVLKTWSRDFPFLSEYFFLVYFCWKLLPFSDKFWCKCLTVPSYLQRHYFLTTVHGRVNTTCTVLPLSNKAWFVSSNSPVRRCALSTVSVWTASSSPVLPCLTPGVASYAGGDDLLQPSDESEAFPVPTTL